MNLLVLWWWGLFPTEGPGVGLSSPEGFKEDKILVL